jgi:hypothetical protein
VTVYSLTESCAITYLYTNPDCIMVASIKRSDYNNVYTYKRMSPLVTSDHYSKVKRASDTQQHTRHFGCNNPKNSSFGAR